MGIEGDPRGIKSGLVNVRLFRVPVVVGGFVSTIRVVGLARADALSVVILQHFRADSQTSVFDR